ncbi:MAG TPA: hypothetical protein DCE80_04615 [Ignavibacteriales bacterium]|nr:hypothetical protein [Ignavibacteriales bacterium]
MTREEFERFREFVNNNEGEAWERSQELRQRFETSYENLFANLRIETIGQARAMALRVVRKTLGVLDGVVDMSRVDLGHGIGHVARDYLHAQVLSQKLVIDPKQAYIGIIAGCLHDILGCTLVERYSESKRVVRHAEASGLLFHKISKKIDLDPNEALLVYYAIAAHTHYLKPSEIVCSDGVMRVVVPYQDTDKESKPIMAVFLTRWIDRLDINGPCFIGRHFLTTVDDHEDFAAGNFYNVNFQGCMRPLLRIEEEIKKDPSGRTTREHLATLARSQNNDSPYGRFDYGGMVVIRDAYKAKLFRIIEAFVSPIVLTDLDERILLSQWANWLFLKIEPSESARIGSVKLQEKFQALPVETKQAWFGAMKTTFREFNEWSVEMKFAISDLPESEFVLPVIGDVRKVL